MKLLSILLTAAFFVISFLPGFAQKGQNEFEKTRIAGRLDNVQAAALLKELEGPDANAFNTLKTALTTHTLLVDPASGTAQADLNTVESAVGNTFAKIDSGQNAAIILVYRSIKIKPAAGGTVFDADFASLKTKIYHKQAYGDDLSNYLLATKKIYFIFIDLSDAYYAANQDDNDKKLSNTTLKIVRKKSFFRQSAEGLGNVISQFMNGASDAPSTLKLTIVEIDPKSNKSPCDIVLSNKSFKEDLTFTVHERNFSEFQVGVVNNKFNLNNFSISGGNLIVQADSTQQANWKSNLYAIIDFHAPRDIDNFQPLWDVLFGPNPYPNHKSGRFVKGWFYNVFVERIGVYGGLKISKDPLSNLYLGFNYAITKELAVNFGWTWANQVQPQVTAVGEISSISDALNYAKRKYGPAQFSWGLSFSPSAVITLLGLKK